jgi:hypothetical protein
MQQLRQQVEAADVAAATRTLASLQGETRAARKDAGDPVWRAGRVVPVAGANLAALQTIAVALDDLVDDGLPPLIETAGLLKVEALVPENGRFDLVPLQQAAPKLAAADAAVRLARDRVAAIPADDLVPRCGLGQRASRQPRSRGGGYGHGRACLRAAAHDARRGRPADLPGGVPEPRRAPCHGWDVRGPHGDLCRPRRD